MLYDGLLQPVGLFLREREADGFGFHLGGPGEAGARLPGRPAVDGTIAEVADPSELLAKFGIAGFQWGETRWSHGRILCPKGSLRQV